MSAARGARRALLAVLTALAVAGGIVAGVVATHSASRTYVTAYFANSNGIYPHDQVRIMGVPVGEIESIEPQPLRSKITFWVDNDYSVPADAKALVLSPTLVSSRYIQLAPAYTGGPQLQNHAVIPQDRTAVPVEYDELRSQLEKLTDTLQPTRPGGVSTAGAFVDSVANNLRGEGANIRDTIVKLSEAVSILGDHSGDIFGTVQNVSILVSALHDSSDVLRHLNQNLAAVTGLLAEDPNAVGRAITDMNAAITDLRDFLTDNREPLGTSFDKLGEIAKALGDSLDDVKQTLHIAPTAIGNFVNIYQPAQASGGGNLAGNQFSNPINFICGAIQAASRLGAAQSAKLCVQYLAPILKNRQYNFLGPIGLAGTPTAIPLPLGPLAIPFPIFPISAIARPNEVTFSEDWLRPDFVPPAQEPGHPGPGVPAPPGPGVPAPAVPTNPAAGLSGMMIPPGHRS